MRIKRSAGNVVHVCFSVSRKLSVCPGYRLVTTNNDTSIAVYRPIVQSNIVVYEDREETAAAILQPAILVKTRQKLRYRGVIYA